MQNIENTSICQQTKIPYLKLDQGSKPCLFVHANGYPSHCYLPLLEQLMGYTIFAPLSRPCWDETDPNARDQWPLLEQDFLAFARARYQETGQKITAIGHSMGCIVVLKVVNSAPELFDKVVFIEPIFLNSATVEIANLLPSTIKKRLKLVSKTLNRPDQWPSLQHVFDFHRPKRAFKQLSNPALWQYIVGATKPDDNQWCLSYPKAWEAWFYQNPPRAWHQLKQLELPVLGLRGEKSEFLSASNWQKWQAILPYNKYIEFKDQHHLLPLEVPKAVAHAILDFLD